MKLLAQLSLLILLAACTNNPMGTSTLSSPESVRFTVPADVTEVHSSTANGSYFIGATIDIVVSFTKNIYVITKTGTPTLTLGISPTPREALYLGGSGSSQLTFRYTVQAGDSSNDLDYASDTAIKLNGGRIFDRSGTNAILTLPLPGSAGSLAANQDISISRLHHFEITSGYSAQTSGVPFNLQILAKDIDENTVTEFAGNVSFSINGTRAAGSIATVSNQAQTCTFSTADLGIKNCPITLNQTGSNWSIRAFLLKASGETGSITVSAGPLDSIRFIQQPGPTPLQAGVSLTQAPQVGAYDAQGNFIPSTANGTIQIAADTGSCGGSASVIPSGITLGSSATLNGVSTFSGIVPTQVSMTRLQAYTSGFEKTTCSGAFVVNPGVATQIAFSSVPNSAIAGTPISVTLTASDAYGNIATGYNGSISFASSDPLFTPPSGSSFLNGVKTLSLTLKTAGSSTLTANSSSLTVTSSALSVGPGTATQLTFNSVPSTATAGSSFNVIVIAKDPFGNTASGFTGVVSITSSDLAAALPSASTLVSGIGSFAAVLKTSGTKSLTATSGSISVTSASILVGAGAYSTSTSVVTASSSSITAGGSITVTLTTKDAYGNLNPSGLPALSAIAFTSSLVGGTGSFGSITHAGSGVYNASYTISTSGSYSLGATFSGTSASSTANFTVNPASIARISFIKSNSTDTSPTSAGSTAGNAFATQPVITAYDTYGNVVSNPATGNNYAITLKGYSSVTSCSNTSVSGTIDSSSGSGITADTLTGGFPVKSMVEGVTPSFGNVKPLKTSVKYLVASDAFGHVACSSAFTVSPGAIATLSFASPGAGPSPLINYTSIPFDTGTPAIVAYDANSNLVTNSTSQITLQGYTSSGGTCGSPVTAGMTGNVDTLSQAITSGTGIATFSNVIATNTAVKRLRASIVVNGSTVSTCSSSDLSIYLLEPMVQFTDSSSVARSAYTVRAANCTGLNSPYPGCVSSSTKIPVGSPITLSRTYYNYATGQYSNHVSSSANTIGIKLTPVTATSSAFNGATLLNPSSSAGTATSTNYYTPGYTLASPSYTANVIIPAGQSQVVIDTASMGIPNLSTAGCTSGTNAPCNADTYFVITLTSTTLGSIGPSDRVQVNIIDPTYVTSTYDGGGDVAFSHSLYSVSGGSTASLIVHRPFGNSSSTGDLTGSETIDVSYLRGLGTNGVDYQSSSGTQNVTFSANETEKTITIPTFRTSANSSFFVQLTPHSITGNLTRGSTTLSGISSTTGIYAGQPIRGFGIPSGTTITSVLSGSLILSQAATATQTGMTFYTGSVRGQSVAKVRILNTDSSDVAVTASATACKVGATPFGGGLGTQSYPYLICDTTQWANMVSTSLCDSSSTQVGGYSGSGGVSATCQSSNRYFKLMKDLTGPSAFASGAALGANLNGNEYMIVDFRGTSSASSSLLSGNGGTLSPSPSLIDIRALNVIHASITGSSAASSGILINTLSGNGATLSDILVSGYLQTSAGNSALLVGLNDRGGSTTPTPIQYALTSGLISVSAGNAIGGLVGGSQITTLSTADLSVKSSYSTANIYAGTSSQVGGILGYHTNSGVSSPGYTYDLLGSSGLIYGKTYVGGMLGLFELGIPSGSVTHTLSNSISRGSTIATGNGASAWVGGMVGMITCDPLNDGSGPCSNSTFTLNQDSNFGSVHAANSTSTFAGGLIGKFTSTNDVASSFSGVSFKIQNSANLGSINASKGYAGGIAGALVLSSSLSSATNTLEVSSSWSSGNVKANTTSGQSVAGGIGQIYFGYAATTLDSSAASGAVDCNANSYCGGFIGSLTRYAGVTVGATSSLNISNSFASGSLTNAGSSSGGLVGYSYTPATFTLDYATGDLTTTGSVSAVGGLMGTAYAASGNLLIDRCFATGNVGYGSGSSLSTAGGLIGDFRQATSGFSAILQKSWASGSVTASGSNAGGIAGYLTSNTGTTVTFDKVFSSGAVSASSNCAGGFVGYGLTTGTVSITNSYTLSTLSSNAGANTSARAIFGAKSSTPTVSATYYLNGTDTPSGSFQPSLQTTATLKNASSSIYNFSGWDLNFSGSVWSAPRGSSVCSHTGCPSSSYDYPTLLFQ